ncbi:MAG: molybdate ABC transporter substrate-binding protein [Cyanobacteria bacterium SBC]|nr:molybdate ABC transporter substrate-binding protein [Cyanobacteria bacterium SBC]
MKRRAVIAIAVSFVLSSVLGACNRPAETSEKRELVIAAAAGTKVALDAIEPEFEQAHPNIDVVYHYAASGKLQQQIEQGAPVDVFLSAAAPQMNALEEKGLIHSDTRRIVLKNNLVLIVPQGKTPKPTSFEDLTDDSVKTISVGEFRSVPVGQYAEAVFESLGILDRITPKLAFAGTVRAILAAVESGNVDAGVVYGTEARRSDEVEVVAEANPARHPPIVYPIAILQRSKVPEPARAFLDFLDSDRATEIFESKGFTVNREDS